MNEFPVLSCSLDEEDYGGHSALLGEGFMPSFFVFQVRERDR